MSIQAMVWVFDYSEAEGNDRLVLLAIANHADAMGWNAWPSVKQIGKEARVSRATVFRCLESLVELGELEITQSGGGRAKTNHYGIPMKRSHFETVSPETVSNPALNGLKSASETVSPVRPEPKENRPEPRAPAHVSAGGSPASPSGPGPYLDREETLHRPRYHDAFVAEPAPTEEERERSRARLRALRSGNA